MHNLNTQSLLFKAYRKGKSAKVPANNTSYTYDEVKACENYGATCKDNIIDVSVDDLEMFDHLLNLLDDLGINCYALYSPHGGHTYWKYDGDIAGTIAQSKRVEAIKIELENTEQYSIEYRTQIQDVGWQDWANDGEISGTEARSLRIETIADNE